MHKLITAALLATTIASPLFAQNNPDNRGQGADPYGRDARQHDRQSQPGRDDRHDGRAQGQPDGHGARPDVAQQGGGRPDFHRDDRGFAGNAPGRGPDQRPGPDRAQWQGRGPDHGPAWQGDDRGPGRGPRPGGWQDRHGPGGWDQRWRSDQRYDWHGYRDSHRDAFRAPGYYAPRGYGYRRFQPGYRIDALFYDQRYWIADPYAYRLPPAYGPYRWVRYFDDVLLIDLRSGLVVDEIPDFFY